MIYHKEKMLSQDVKFRRCQWCSGIMMIILWFLVCLLSIFHCYDIIDKSIFVPDQAITAAQVETQCPDKMKPAAIPTDLQSKYMTVSYLNTTYDGGLPIQDYRIMFRVP